MVNAHFSLPIISVGEVEPEQLTSQIAGKVVAINVSKKGIEQEMTLFERRYPRFIKAKYLDSVKKLGAKGIVFITDEISDKAG